MSGFPIEAWEMNVSIDKLYARVRKNEGEQKRKNCIQYGYKSLKKVK